MIWLIMSLMGCSREDFYATQSLSQSVKNVYDDCDEGRIGFLKRKSNVQTIFSDCGSNNVYNFDWSPNGTLMYFQAYTNAFILNPENKGVDQLPVDSPTDKAVWLNDQTIIIPVIDSSTNKPTLTVYQITGELTKHAIPGSKPQDLQRYTDGKILLSIVNDSGKRVPYSFGSTSGFERVLPFVNEVNNISAAPNVDLLAYADASGTHITKMTGESIVDFPDAHRGIPHPEGKYIALEVDGAPMAPVDMGDGKYKAPEVQEREEKRRQQRIDNLPDWAPQEVIPPEIHVYNVENQRRYRMTQFFGAHFQWYPTQKYFCSLYIQGIGGQFINPNVGLTDIGVALLMADNDDYPSSVELWEPNK